MKGRVPFITEVIFYCPECGKKKRVDVEVWITSKKNYFTFECKECQNRWIVDICKAKSRTLPIGGFFPTTEPQVQFINRITNELQPMLKKEIVGQGKIRIIKSIGETIEVQPLGKIKIGDADLFDFSGGSEGLGRIGIGGARIKVRTKIGDLKK